MNTTEYLRCQSHWVGDGSVLLRIHGTDRV